MCTLAYLYVLLHTCNWAWAGARLRWPLVFLQRGFEGIKQVVRQVSLPTGPYCHAVTCNCKFFFLFSETEKTASRYFLIGWRANQHWQFRNSSFSVCVRTSYLFNTIRWSTLPSSPRRVSLSLPETARSLCPRILGNVPAAPDVIHLCGAATKVLALSSVKPSTFTSQYCSQPLQISVTFLKGMIQSLLVLEGSSPY